MRTNHCNHVVRMAHSTYWTDVLGAACRYSRVIYLNLKLGSTVSAFDTFKNNCNSNRKHCA